MTIIHVSADTAAASGVGTFVRHIDAALNRLGVDSRVMERWSGGEVERWSGGAVVVHIHGLWTGVGHAAAKWARTHGAKIVWSTHGMTSPWAMRHKWWKKCLPWYLFQRHDLRQADLIHCTSDQEVAWNNALGLTRTCIVPLGTEGVRGEAGEKVSGGEGERVLLFVGRIYPVKALDRLIRAFALATADAGASWRLRLVGPDQAGHQAELVRLCESLGLASVEFAGPKFGDDLSAAYASCDALALVSHTENFGATVVDAMAYGKPVITSTKTPWRVVRDERCGWWVDNDPETLAQALRELMAMTDAERAAWGARGRKLVEERYTWEAVGRCMLVEYERRCG